MAERNYSVVTYRVRSGDSLSLITWRFGRPAEATLDLYAANESLIGPDPNDIRIGQELEIPVGWPATATRIDKPDRMWIEAASVALRRAGFRPTPAPSPDPTPSPTPTPEPAPAPAPDGGFGPGVEKRGLTTGAKVAIGVVGVAAVGTGVFLATRRSSQRAAVAGFGGIAELANR